MDKRKWLWKRRSSERNSVDAESSGSMSSQSERCSDDQQEVSKVSPGHNSQSPEVTSKATDAETIVPASRESVKHLKQERNDVSNGSPSYSPQSMEVTSKARDTDVIVKECNGTAKHLTNDLSNAFAGDCFKGSSVKDDMPNGSANSETKLDVVPLRNSVPDKEDNETVKLLTEKLSAALLNVSQKDDIVKQHAKVAEEAVAGWEKAENEAAIVIQQLEAVVQQKSMLESRVSHLDEALKECVRQLRLARDDQEKKIREALSEKTHKWELVKSMLEGQIVQLQAQAESSTHSPDLELQYKLEYLETENIALKQELQLQSEELVVRTIERDLSTKAAETASKQHLESIKKVAKLDAECRRLKASTRIASSKNDHKSATSSYVDSLIDSQSEYNDQMNSSVNDSQKINGLAINHIKDEKAVSRSLTSSSIEIDLMDDFLEMERLAALSETVEKPTSESEYKIRNELQVKIRQTDELEEKVKTLEAEKDEMKRVLVQTKYCLDESQAQLIKTQITLEQLELKLQEISELEQFHESQISCLDEEAQIMSNEIESLSEEIKKERASSSELSSKCRELQDELQRKKQELEEVRCNAASEELKLKDTALAESKNLHKSEAKLKEAEGKLKQLEIQLNEACELKGSLESKLTSAKAEVQTVSAYVNSLQSQVEKEQTLSEKLSTKCRELENELEYKKREHDLQHSTHPTNEMKIKQEDLAVAAGKLAECQRTITSLGNQLSSLATLEDFLIDTASIPGISSAGSLISRGDDESWRLHSNGTFMHKKEPNRFNNSQEAFLPFTNYNGRESAVPTSSSTSSDFLLNHSTSERSNTLFEKCSSSRS